MCPLVNSELVQFVAGTTRSHTVSQHQNFQAESESSKVNMEKAMDILLSSRGFFFLKVLLEVTLEKTLWRIFKLKYADRSLLRECLVCVGGGVTDNLHRTSGVLSPSWVPVTNLNFYFQERMPPA